MGSSAIKKIQLMYQMKILYFQRTLKRQRKRLNFNEKTMNIKKNSLIKFQKKLIMNIKLRNYHPKSVNKNKNINSYLKKKCKDIIIIIVKTLTL